MPEIELLWEQSEQNEITFISVVGVKWVGEENIYLICICT